MGKVNDPSWQTERGNARQLLASVGATPPSTPRPFFDNVDATHPLYIDFVLPTGIKPNFAKLSFKFRLYRTYSSLTLSATGAGAAHNHAQGTSGGGSAHGHSIATGLATMAAFLGFDSLNSPSAWVIGTAIGNTGTGGTTPPTTTESTHTHAQGTGGNESAHTHSISGTSILGVAESGNNTTITAIAIDATDVTATLGGGPWVADTVDLDLTALMPIGNGAFHTITLTPSGLGRITGELRLG